MVFFVLQFFCPMIGQKIKGQNIIAFMENFLQKSLADYLRQKLSNYWQFAVCIQSFGQSQFRRFLQMIRLSVISVSSFLLVAVLALGLPTTAEAATKADVNAQLALIQTEVATYNHTPAAVLNAFNYLNGFYSTLRGGSSPYYMLGFNPSLITDDVLISLASLDMGSAGRLVRPSVYDVAYANFRAVLLNLQSNRL